MADRILREIAPCSNPPLTSDSSDAANVERWKREVYALALASIARPLTDTDHDLIQLAQNAVRVGQTGFEPDEAAWAALEVRAAAAGLEIIRTRPGTTVAVILDGAGNRRRVHFIDGAEDLEDFADVLHAEGGAA